MGKQVFVNRECEINEGVLKGMKGIVVAYDHNFDEVVIQLDDVTQAVITHDRINQ